jgi:DNA repair protein RadC
MHLLSIRDQVALTPAGSRLSDPRDARLIRALGAVVEESIAARVVRTCGQIGIEQFTVAELVSTCGIPQSAARRIAAARDLALAFAEGQVTARHAGDVLDRLPPGLATLETEILLGFALSGTLDIKALVLLAKGGTASAAITPRDVFVPLVRLGAAAVIVVHNHPSGDPSPSEADVIFTNALARAGSVLGIELVDHIVVARGGSVSFADMGLLPTRKELGHD